MKTVATAYFEYVKNSKYAETFTCYIEVGSVSKLIENSIRWFLEGYEVCFDENRTAINNWEKERVDAANGSVSR